MSYSFNVRAGGGYLLLQHRGREFSMTSDWDSVKDCVTEFHSEFVNNFVENFVKKFVNGYVRRLNYSSSLLVVQLHCPEL